MATALIEGIAAYLASKGRGTVGTSIFAGEEPPSPDATITVISEGGGSFPDQLGQETLVTVRTRDPSYAVGLGRAHAVFLDLHEAQGLLGGVHVAYVRATAPLAPTGRDTAGSGGRWRFSQTFRVLQRIGEDLVP